MTKQKAADILNRYPGVIAFDPASGDHPAEVFLEGWFCPEAILAIAWWMQNCPKESWWKEASSEKSGGSAFSTRGHSDMVGGFWLGPCT